MPNFYAKLEAGLREPKPLMYAAMAEAYQSQSAKDVAYEFDVSERTVRRAVAKHQKYKELDRKVV